MLGIEKLRRNGKEVFLMRFISFDKFLEGFVLLLLLLCLVREKVLVPCVCMDDLIINKIKYQFSDCNIDEIRLISW